MTEAVGVTDEVYQKALNLCRQLDADGDGAISRDELSTALQPILFKGCSAQEIEEFIRTVDVNGDGVIQFEEFLSWFRQPAKDRLAFVEQLEEFAAQRENIETSPAPVGDGTELRFLQDFTHPLLARIQPVTEGTAPGAETVTMQAGDFEAAFSKSKRKRAALRQCSNGRFAIKAPPVEVCAKAYSGRTAEEQLQAKLDALSRTYKEVFLEFCLRAALAEQRSSVGLPLDASLRLIVPRLQDDQDGRPLPPATQELVLAALALAAAKLPRSDLKRLEALRRFELMVDDATASNSYSVALAEKVQIATTAPTPSEGGRLQSRGGSFDWVRKDNDAESRLQRLGAFFLTQRAIWSSGYEPAAGQRVNLAEVDRMIQGTQIFSSPASLPGQSRSPESTKSSAALPVNTAGELGVSSLSDASTVMSVALELTKQGKSVAAVSAASAYQVGGGATTGGRHALEEAWCITSTLYSSLQALPDTDEVEAGPLAVDDTKPRQHLPTNGCVLSPNVEIFRGHTGEGYKLLTQPVRISAVLSVAMFNRNPQMSDSPLDSPNDSSLYVAGTRAKLEALLAACVKADVEVIVIPDIGCGVFRNDPWLVGGCLGTILANPPPLGKLRQVVLASTNTCFVDACKRAAKGEDPRPQCKAGADCGLFHDQVHMARNWHPGVTDPIDRVLVGIVNHPEKASKPPCRYGYGCHIRDPRHLARFSHPDDRDVATAPVERVSSGGYLKSGDSLKSQPPVATIIDGLSPRPTSSGVMRMDSGANPIYERDRFSAKPLSTSGGLAPPGRIDDRRPSPARGALGTFVRPECKYGPKCYNTDAKHLADFAHPWRDSETPEARQLRQDLSIIHELLQFAKQTNWERVRSTLNKRPDLASKRPEERQFALIHHAAHQVNFLEIVWLVDEKRVDVLSRTKDGKTAIEVLQDACLEKPPNSPEGKRNDEKVLQWMKARAAGDRNFPVPVMEELPNPAEVAAKAGAIATKGSGGRKGETLYVTSSRGDLRGYYWETLRDQYEYPVYQLFISGKAEQRYLFHSHDPRYGWCIASQPYNKSEPYAYLSNSLCGKNVWDTKLYEIWKVLKVPSHSSLPVYYAHDYLMKVERQHLPDME